MLLSLYGIKTRFYLISLAAFILVPFPKSQWLLLGILVQKVFDTNLNFNYTPTSKKIGKIKALLLCQF